MLIWLSIPPHPTHQGGIDKDSDLFNIWKERLNNLIPLDVFWMKHQNRFILIHKKEKSYFFSFIKR